MHKKITSGILALLMLLSTVSCAESENTDDTSANTPTAAETAASADGTGEDTAAETEADDGTLAQVISLYSDRNYDGYDFRVLDRSPGHWGTEDVFVEEMTGEPINDAVFERNNLLATHLNVNVVETQAGSPVGTLKTSVAAQTDDYDVVTDGLSVLAGIVAANYLMDYNAIPEVISGNKWWDQQLIDGMSVAGKTFMMTGDISIMDNYGTWCMMFNKGIIESHTLENPYTLVEEGRWTLDKLEEMAAAATADLNGDGKWTTDDQYGFVSEAYNTYGLYICFGNKLTERDEAGMPYFVYETEESITALANILDVQYSDCCNMGLFPGLGREDHFKAGGGLFYFAGMINITAFRDSDTDFGIIPAPKENEAQEQYYSTYSPENMTAYSIPVTTTDSARVGDILEAMAGFSAYTLTPAYYEKTLMGKSGRAQESQPMIELILSTRNFDLGSIFDWGKTASTIRGLENSGNVASALKKISKMANKGISKWIDEVTAMNEGTAE